MTAARLDLPIGIGAGGRHVGWNIRPKGAGVAHCLVYGPTGVGKTACLETLAGQAMDRGHIIYIIDPKADDFEEWREQGICPVATDADSITAMVAAVRRERVRRVRDYRKTRRMAMLASGELPSILLVVDEMQSMLDMLGSTTRKPAQAMVDLSDIARQGRSAGVHLLLGTQYPTVDAVGGGTVRNQCGMVIALGDLSVEARRLTGIQSSLTAHPPGRAIVSWPGHEIEVQVALSEPRTVATASTVPTGARIGAVRTMNGLGWQDFDQHEQAANVLPFAAANRGLLPPLSENVVARIVALRGDGWPLRRIAAEVGVSVAAVHKYASRVPADG